MMERLIECTKNLRRCGFKALPPHVLRVLVLILRTEGRLSHREMAMRLGNKSPNEVFICLQILRDAGLIEFEPRKGRTIRPTCFLRIFTTPGQFSGGSDAQQ